MSLFKVWFLTLITASSLAAADLTLTQKLELKIPSIKLKDVTLNQAIEAIRRHAKELDPDGSGINIIVKQQDLPAKGIKINLNLTDIPLRDSLNYVANSVGLNISVSSKVVMIAKVSQNQFTTKLYRVSSSFKSFVNSKNRASIKKADLEKFFSITGLTFPKGSSMAYVAGKNILSITNTHDNQNKARKALVALNCLR